MCHPFLLLNDFKKTSNHRLTSVRCELLWVCCFFFPRVLRHLTRNTVYSLVFSLFFCYWWSFFFLSNEIYVFSASTSSRATGSWCSLIIMTAALKDLPLPLMKKQQNEALEAGTCRFIRKSMVQARLLWKYYIVLIFLSATLGFGISQSNKRSHLFLCFFTNPVKISFFFSL